MRRRRPLRDPIQEVIDRQMRGIVLDQPSSQKNCHPLGSLEDEILDALDRKALYGGYDGFIPVEMFSLSWS